MIRFFHLVTVCALISAAAYVYKIKFDATVQVEVAARLHAQIRHERDTIAALRAEWARLDNPARIQELAQRHLKLRPVDATQFDNFTHLPERPPQIVSPMESDPIAAIIENTDAELATGSVANGARQ